MGITSAKWDGSASNYPDAGSYCDACLINDNTGDRKDWIKDACKLPVKDANGDINTNALSSAAAVLNGGMGGLKGVSAADKASAARKLLQLYAQAKMPPPDALKGMA